LIVALKTLMVAIFFNPYVVSTMPFLEIGGDMVWRNKVGVHTFSFDRNRFEVNTYTIMPDGRRGQALNPDWWVVGNSSSFGFGVNDEDTFAHILGYTNYSVLGYDCGAVAGRLNNLLGVFSPPKDVIIWCGMNNTDLTRHYFWREGLGEWYAQRRYIRQMKEILNICKTHGIRPHLVTFPLFQESSKVDGINNWVRGSGIPYYDLAKLFKGKDKSYYAKVDDVIRYHYHPSAKGHKMIAEEMGI